MATAMMIQYDNSIPLLSTLAQAMVQAGAKLIEPRTKTISQPNDFDIVAQHLYGKRRNGKYTEKELFLINSKINAGRCFAKHLD